MKRVFLDWTGGLLPRVASWLVGEFGADMRGVLVALPGARAGRLLQELLAREVGPTLRPPQVVTVGVLSDELLQVEGAAAGRLVRTLAWEQALRALAPDQLARIVARPPAPDDRRAWGALAEEVRGLFGEVAAEGQDFSTVEASPVLKDLAGEVQRWRALGQAQEGMQRRLEKVGMHDPHLGRLSAIDAGKVRTPRHVVLVGAVEMNALLRRSLEACSAPQTSLVLAPESESERFDMWGCLIPEKWTARETSLSLDQWHVVDRPADQARVAARVLASWGSTYRAEEISIGIADPEVSPYIKSRFAESGIRARDAAGTPMARTAAVQLLAAVGSFLRSRSFRDLAVLVRHADFERALRALDGELEPLEILDDYHRSHIPWRADGDWAAEDGDKRDQSLRRQMNGLWKAVREVLGDLQETDAAPVKRHADSARRLLERVYGPFDLHPANDGERITIASLRCLARGIHEQESLPEALAPHGSTAESLDLLLRVASSRNNDVPAAAARAGQPTVEMMGWLELPLDDAPALVVTGFQDGKVPESVRGDAYLPNRLRRDLGIVDNEHRLARDLYATELLVQSRTHLAFITGRRSVAGDPQLPSRVVFHCAKADVARRVRRFLSSEKGAATGTRIENATARELPRRAGTATPEVISVSAFKAFLDSPYSYYLQHVLKLKTRDDRAQEMDGAAFGNMAHAVLQRFGEDQGQRDEQDAGKIAGFLTERLEQLGLEIYGKRPLPAIQLQLDQLAYRLTAFATEQARRRAAGWRIHEVEWEPRGGAVDFPVDGEPIRLRGRIDRIDRHEKTGAWAIWDYKTGDNVLSPLSAHRRGDGKWKDLQLPLYTFLVTELIGDAHPAELGYIAIGRNANNLGFRSVSDWRRPKGECDDSDEALGKGLEVAAEIVRRIRAGEFFDTEGWQPYEKVFAAIGGVGLVGVADAGQEESE